MDTSNYALDFLKGPNFKSEILTYIRTQFADMLDQEDMELLARGDAEALDALSKKIQSAYQSGAKKIMDV